MAKSVSLYSYEYCSSPLGIWSRAWFARRQPAEAARREQLKSYGRDPDAVDEDEELTGEYGQVGKVARVVVPMTAVGVLRFAEAYGPQE
jgi:hypothetical protein